MAICLHTGPLLPPDLGGCSAHPLCVPAHLRGLKPLVKLGDDVGGQGKVLVHVHLRELDGIGLPCARIFLFDGHYSLTLRSIFFRAASTSRSVPTTPLAISRTAIGTCVLSAWPKRADAMYLMSVA